MVFEHNCNRSGCDHQPSDQDSLSCSLFSKIDLDNVKCFNEDQDGSCRKVFRSWDDRLNRSYTVKSDIDQDLLFNIPFCGSVKLKSIVIIGPSDDSHPFSIKLFKNRPAMTFDNLSNDCDQEISLAQDPNGLIAYPLKQVKFSWINHLAIYVPRNYSNNSEVSTSIYYIGLNGEFQSVNKQQVVIANYEAKPNPADHKTDLNKNIYQNIF
jgi:hypothetical protein